MQWELRLFILRHGITGEAFKAFRKIPRQGPREQMVPEEEFEAVLHLASPRLRLAMLLARDAALRRSAIESFTNGNIDFDHGEVFGITKNRQRYRVPMTRRLRAALADVAFFAAKGEPLIAVMSHNRRPVKACTILWELKRAQEQCFGDTKPWSMHDLRRTAARNLYDQTRDIRKVQRLLGHASPVATWWYIGNAGTDLSGSDLETLYKPPEQEKKA